MIGTAIVTLMYTKSFVNLPYIYIYVYVCVCVCVCGKNTCFNAFSLFVEGEGFKSAMNLMSCLLKWIDISKGGLFSPHLLSFGFICLHR